MDEKRRRWLSVISLLVLGIVLTVQFIVTRSTLAASEPVYSGDTSRPRIAITFDDGPSPETPQVLDTLAQYQVKATFFVVGSQVNNYPDYARRIVNEGHTIANHTWDHSSLTDLADADVNQQLSATSNAIQNATGVRPSLMRPPFGAWDQRVLNLVEAQGLQAIMWNLDAADWTDPGIDAIVASIVNGTKNGSIILLHDGWGRAQTTAALPSILQQLQAKGFQFVTVPELLAPSSNNPVTLQPTEDRDNYATSAGNDTSIHASIYQTAYLKFNLSPAPSNITNAKLRIYRPYATDTVTVTAHEVFDDSWSENNNSLPALGAQIQAVTFTGAGYVEFNVSSFVAAQKSGDGVVSIALKASSTYWTSFHSKDNVENQPELVVS